MGVTGWADGQTGEIMQPVMTAEIAEVVQDADVPDQYHLDERAIREIVTDLETMGLVETWIDSRGREGRVKQIQTTFDPEWVAATWVRGHYDHTDRNLASKFVVHLHRSHILAFTYSANTGQWDVIATGGWPDNLQAIGDDLNRAASLTADWYTPLANSIE